MFVPLLAELTALFVERNLVLTSQYVLEILDRALSSETYSHQPSADRIKKRPPCFFTISTIFLLCAAFSFFFIWL